MRIALEWSAVIALHLCSSTVLAALSGPGSVIDVIENPNPMTFDTFGAAVQVIGDDLAVAALGAKNGPFYEGAVYQFEGAGAAAGQLLHEYRRPQLQDADRFGHALASSGHSLAVADPRYIIGATERAGAVHIYDSSSGQYVRSILNPTPAYLDVFGWDVVTTGSTLVISELSEISHDPKTYLYNIDTGALIRTITKPSGAKDFGTALAIVGNQVFVGGTMGQRGAVFSFDAASGQLIRTFLDPTPEPFNSLDTTLATVGNKLVIGGLSEEAYVVDISTGALLTTITDPGASNGRFSTSLAPYGDDLLISSHSGPTAHVVDLDTGDVLLTFDIPQASDFPALIGAYLSLAELNGNIVIGHPAWRNASRGPHDEGRVFVVRGIAEPSSVCLMFFGIAAAIPSVWKRHGLTSWRLPLVKTTG